MADQSDTPKILDEIAQNTRSKSGRHENRGRVGSVFLWFLILSLVTGVGYLGYQQWLLTEQVNLLRADTGNAQIQLGELTGQTRQLSSRYGELSADLNSGEVDRLRSEYADLSDSLALQVEEITQLRANVENQGSSLEILRNQDSQLQQIQTQLAQADPEIVVDNSASLALEQRLNARVSQLTAQIEQLQQQDASQQSSVGILNFRLLEVEYLLRLANQKLMLDDDLAGALRVHQSVRELLTEAGVTEVTLMQQLEQERILLEQLSLVDLELAYQNINELQAQINDLDLSNSLSHSQGGVQSSLGFGLSNPGTESNIQGTGLWDSALDLLGSVFVWRRWEESPDAMLPAVQDSYTRQNLYLWLEHAKLALLSRNQDNFQQSIENSTALLSVYMTADDLVVQNFLVELENLLSVTIQSDLPSVSGSLSLVRQLIEENKQ